MMILLVLGEQEVVEVVHRQGWQVLDEASQAQVLHEVVVEDQQSPVWQGQAK